MCDVIWEEDNEEERLGLAVVFRWREFIFNQEIKRKLTGVSDEEISMLFETKTIINKYLLILRNPIVKTIKLS